MTNSQKTFIRTVDFSCPACNCQEFELYHVINSKIDTIPQGLTRANEVNEVYYRCVGCKLEINKKALNNFDFKSLYTKDLIYSSTDGYFKEDEYPQYSIDIIEILKKYTKPGYKVLEIGCGSGQLLAKMSEMGLCAEGIDLDPRSIKMAKEKGLKARHGEIFNDDYSNKKYDIILGVAILEHIENPNIFFKNFKNDIKKWIDNIPIP